MAKLSIERDKKTWRFGDDMSLSVSNANKQPRPRALPLKALSQLRQRYLRRTLLEPALSL